VVGTDGLFDYATIDAIRAVAAIVSPGNAHALVHLPRAARSRALADDVTVVAGWLDEPRIPAQHRDVLQE
jgi:hypothetical protein